MRSTTWRSGVPAALGAAVLAAAVLTHPTTATAKPELDTSGPLAFTGTVTRVGSLDAAAVVVSLEPSSDRIAKLGPGDRYTLRRLPASAVHTSGNRFAVVVDPATIPASHVSEDGKVNFEVDVLDPVTSRRATTSTTVRRVTWAGDQVWADALTQVGPATRRRAAETFSAPRLVTSALDVGAHADPDEVRAELVERLPHLVTSGQRVGAAAPTGVRLSGPSGRAAAAAAAAAAGCTDGPERRRWATVGTSYPVGKHTSWLEYTANTDTTFGTAVSVDRGVSWKASGTKTVDDNWGQNFLPKSKLRSYRVKIDYRLVTCHNVYGYETSRKWKAFQQPGYTTTHKLSKRPNWTQCGPVAAGDWFRGMKRGNDYRLSYGVKFKGVLGIHLSTRRAYSTEAALYYWSPVERRMCGNNDDAALASKVRERHA